jgi:hypothetical protein
VLGGFLNKALPVWLTTTLLTALLLVMSERLWRKAKSLYDNETAHQLMQMSMEPEV